MLVSVVFVLISFMLPVQVWRTGELPATPIQVQQAEPFTVSPVRVWIDTDAACGQGQRTDPDDCLAILLLAQQDHIHLVGVSTIYGNTRQNETDRVTRDLIDVIEKNGRPTIPVYSGTAEPLNESVNVVHRHEAHEALSNALKEPLVIVALGPLTNIAIALKYLPQLQANVTQLVAVMGRRKGHVFHPVEGGTAHSFFGHGPIFRDFNLTEDEQAAAAILAMGLPLTLIPYEAARNIVLDASCLDKMAARGGPAAWVAHHARPWLSYWQEDIGIDAFYPFDLVAASYIAQPSLLSCANVPIGIEEDTWLFGWLGYRGLFVESTHETGSQPLISGTALYCPEVSKHLEAWLMDQLTGEPKH
jgi:inosine-uridine nucleoside N-ribohydrolase